MQLIPLPDTTDRVDGKDRSGENVPPGKIQVLDAQAHHLHQAKSAAIHELSHDLVNPLHFIKSYRHEVCSRDPINSASSSRRMRARSSRALAKPNTAEVR